MLRKNSVLSLKWSTVERVGAKNLPVGRMLKKKIKKNALSD